MEPAGEVPTNLAYRLNADPGSAMESVRRRLTELPGAGGRPVEVIWPDGSSENLAQDDLFRLRGEVMGVLLGRLWSDAVAAGDFLDRHQAQYSQTVGPWTSHPAYGADVRDARFNSFVWGGELPPQSPVVISQNRVMEWMRRVLSPVQEQWKSDLQFGEHSAVYEVFRSLHLPFIQRTNDLRNAGSQRFARGGRDQEGASPDQIMRNWFVDSPAGQVDMMMSMFNFVSVALRNPASVRRVDKNQKIIDEGLLRYLSEHGPASALIRIFRESCSPRIIDFTGEDISGLTEAGTRMPRTEFLNLLDPSRASKVSSRTYVTLTGDMTPVVVVQPKGPLGRCPGDKQNNLATAVSRLVPESYADSVWDLSDPNRITEVGMELFLSDGYRGQVSSLDPLP